MSGLDGILLVDKPQGATSYAVVHHVRRALQRDFRQIKDGHAARPPDAHGHRPPRFRCGHAGTLDPMATGLLVVLVGRGTRLAPFLTALDKVYQATVSFGVETDTLDAEGKPVRTAPPPADPRAVTDLLPGFTGRIMQTPPIYSALKRQGRSLHELARAGLPVDPPQARPVVIHSLQAAGVRWGEVVHELDLVVHCGSGTYVRSLAADLARAAGSAGHLSALRRTRVGPFDLQAAAAGVLDLAGMDLARLILPLPRAVAHWPRVRLSAQEARAVGRGAQPLPGWLQRLEPAQGAGDRRPGGGGPASGAGVFALLDEDGGLVAVAEDAGAGPPVLRAVIAAEDS